MADVPKLITAAELDQMSPDERARVVREHIVTDLDHLPDDFRRPVDATAGRLVEHLDRPGVDEPTAAGPRLALVLRPARRAAFR